MRFLKKPEGDEDEQLFSVNWEDQGKEHLLCMCDHEGKADVILSVMTYVTTNSPQFSNVLENIRDEV